MRIYGFLLLLAALMGFEAGALTITGKISDTSGKPVPFCSVYLKGSTIGTTANSEGEYSLDVAPGNYEIVFRCIGYKLASREISVTEKQVEIDISLEMESYRLKEAVVNASAEDPAYAIMRKAIKNRKKHLHETTSFSCRAYVKSTQKLLTYPKKFLGQDLNFGDYLDTVSKIFYLSESVSNLSISEPDKVKEEMISSKVSGDSRTSSFNKSSDLRVNFYENLISMGNLSPRGMVSPLSATAMLYYDYRLEGTFLENGEVVNKIKVIPKRKHDPVFSGDVYIIEDLWRIHSLDLFITKDQQIEFIDTFRVTQTYIPVEKNAWMLLNSEFNFEFRVLGFRGKGTILGVFSNYNVHPDFPPRYFSSEVMKINRDANKKDTVYWDQVRPVPLTLEEDRDYVKRDSLFDAHNTKEYKDSLDKKSNKFGLPQLLLTGYRRQNSYANSVRLLSPLIQNIQFNTVEGWVLGLNGRYYKYESDEDLRRISIGGEARYGISNRHFNGNMDFNHWYNTNGLNRYSIKAGSDVMDFNGNAHFAPLVNTAYSLLAEKNWLKLYEQIFGELFHCMELWNGVVWNMSAKYADRIPLANTTDFAWHNDPERSYLSNDPLHPETDSLHFIRNQSFVLNLFFQFSFRQRYITRPEGKSILGSKYPELIIGYKKAIPEILGSDADFDLAHIRVADQIRMGLFGGVRYSVMYGKFLRDNRMEFMDYHHFNGNLTFYSDFSLSDFSLLDYYRFSTNKDYFEAHGEYNLGGLILNKFPLLRKLKLSEIVSAHCFYANYSGGMNSKSYYETAFGIEKFGLLRADFVLGFDEGNKVRTGFVVGLKININNGSVRRTD